MSETLDIVALVQNNPLTRLLGHNYESHIVNKIKEKFNSYDEQLFVANFYCYLNYDTRKDFVIDLDQIWKWLGFGKKSDCKSLLTNNFEENEDFMVSTNHENFAAANSAAKHDNSFAANSGKNHENYFAASAAKKETRGGHNQETILLTIRCFKKLCLKAKTKKSNDIHEYYLNLEELINDIVYEESTILRNQLALKDNQLQLKDQENETTLVNNFDGKPVVYLIQVQPDLIKFGYSNNIKRRIAEHKSDFGKDIVIRTLYETLYNREFEQMIKIRFKKNIIEKNNQTELIQLTSKFTYQHLQNEIEKLKTEVNADLVPRLMKEITELRQKVNELLTPNNLEVINLRAKVADLELQVVNLELQLSRRSDASVSELKAKNAELELQLSKENREAEKLELRKKELDLKYAGYKRFKNNMPHRIENGIEQKFCPGILCREETGEDGQWLELSLFGKSAQNKDGLRNECKKCRCVTERNNYKRSEHENKMSAEELEKSRIGRSLKLRTQIIDGKKICSDCNESKELSEFGTNGKYITGEFKYRSSCNACINSKRKEQRSQLKPE